MPSLLPPLLFRGDFILAVTDDFEAPTTHAMATLRVDCKPPDQASKKLKGKDDLGCGIYACFFDGKLFYIGIFAGTGPTKRGSVIRERWRKHIGGMTLRGVRVTICRRDIRRIRAANRQSPLAKLIVDTPESTMSKDKGLQTTYGKFQFAQLNWLAFRNFSIETLKRFQFAYVACDPDHWFGQLDKPTLKKNLEKVEHGLVRTFLPPCNRRAHNESGRSQHGILGVVRGIRRELSAHIDRLGHDLRPSV